MTSWRIVRFVAGSFLMLSLALGMPQSPFYQSQHWLWFTLFVGANLFQSSLTGWCLMAQLLEKFGVQKGC